MRERVVGWRAGLGLALFLLVVFGFPLLLSTGIPEETDSDAKPDLANSEPEFVFLGNSLLETRIDPGRLTESLGGRRVVSLAVPSTGSAAWYLQLKNVVVPDGESVGAVFIFFHKDLITRPHEGLIGRNRGLIAGLLSDDESEYFRVINESRSAHQRMVAALEDAYPLQRLSDSAHDGMAELAAFLLPSSRESLSSRADDTFAFHNRREPRTENLPADPIRKFEDAVDQSFLPLMLDVARAHDIRLVFVRVQERPNEDGSVHESLAMHEYSLALAAYLASAGAGYVDFTGNPAVDRAMYYDTFHIRDRYLSDYTDFFHREMAQYFDAAGSVER